jgi:hypothetical protein
MESAGDRSMLRLAGKCNGAGALFGGATDPYARWPATELREPQRFALGKSPYLRYGLLGWTIDRIVMCHWMI